MHWENLASLLPALPFIALLVVLLAGWGAMERIHRLRLVRQSDNDMRRYWLAEKAYHAKLRARAWLDRSRAPKLFYSPRPTDAPIAAGLVEDYGENPVPDKTISTRLARARFRAWHRGTREADFMIGGFFDRHHAAWAEAELGWFEALLEEDDADVLAWAMGTREAPAKYRGPLMDALKKLDFVAI
jgi:antitoxin CptB